MSALDIIDTIIDDDNFGSDAVLKIESLPIIEDGEEVTPPPTETNVRVVFLDEFQKAQLLNVEFEGGSPLCLMKTTDHAGALSNRDHLKIIGVNGDAFFTIRSIQPNSKGSSIIKLSTD